MTRVLFWDVDTQSDFIDPDGKLTAPGASAIVPNLRKLTRYSRRDLIHAGSVDAHTPRDNEFKVWPSHCVYGTPGQLKIPETIRGKPIYIPSKRLTRRQLKESIGSCDQLLFEKQHNDARTNPNVEPYLRAIAPDLIVVYGVATDICVDLAVKYVTELGYPTEVVEDAVKEIDEKDVERCVSDWVRRGVKLTTTDRLLHELGD